MRAGRLRYLAEVIDEQIVRMPSGGVRKTLVSIATIRADKKKQLVRYDRDGYVAKEEYNGDTITLRVRKAPIVDRINKIRFLGTLYNVQMKEVDIMDNSYTLVCIKVDE